MNYPKVGLVVLSWNNEDLLPACFDSIAGLDYPNIRVVLVDNASSDKSVALTKEKYPWVEVIVASKNGGFTKGNNIGIDHLMQDEDVAYVGLINTDATLDTVWLRRIVDFARYKPRGALFQGTTLDYYNHEIVDSTHIFVANGGQATQGGWRTQFTGDLGPMRTFGSNAAACLIARKFIESQPFDTFFDESFFMYLEDVDIALRAMIMGWDSYLVNGALAYHMGSASSGKNPGFSLKMTYRNNMPMLFKNLPTGMFLGLVPKAVKSDVMTSRLLFSRRNIKGLNALWKGRLLGLLRLPLYIRKKNTMRSVCAVDSGYLKTMMRRGF